jgi:hypothetical protein
LHAGEIALPLAQASTRSIEGLGMIYGILALAVLYLSFFVNNVWAHLLVTLLIVIFYVRPRKLGRLVGRSG